MKERVREAELERERQRASIENHWNSSVQRVCEALPACIAGHGVLVYEGERVCACVLQMERLRLREEHLDRSWTWRVLVKVMSRVTHLKEGILFSRRQREVLEQMRHAVKVIEVLLWPMVFRKLALKRRAAAHVIYRCVLWVLIFFSHPRCMDSDYANRIW